MVVQSKEVALRKRNQIAKANQAMFAWVASASVVIGIALVVSIFLVQKIVFNEKVLAEKDKTVAVLKANNGNISELEAQVRILDNNQALTDAKAKEGDQAIQVILDALPSDANSLALGASLQKKLLDGVDGLTLESLQVDPVSASLITSASRNNGSSQPEIAFRFSVSGSEAALKQVMLRLERSIRAIDVLSFTVESQGSSNILTVQARAFYEPVRVVELKDKVIKS